MVKAVKISNIFMVCILSLRFLITQQTENQWQHADLSGHKRADTSNTLKNTTNTLNSKYSQVFFFKPAPFYDQWIKQQQEEEEEGNQQKRLFG